MSNALTIARRELLGYFATPIAYVFLVIFLTLLGWFTFYWGTGFFEMGQADLRGFFGYHPILYVVLIPALTMRLWAEERRGGTIELLMTLPITTAEAVLGKFLAAWAFTGVALLLTLPMWWTVNHLGEPDNGVIAASYLGSFLMAGGYLAVGGAISACTKNQVIAFVLAVVACLLLLLAGFPQVTELLSQSPFAFLGKSISSVGFLTHFDSISRGVIDLSSLLFFSSLIALMLFLNKLALDRLAAS